MHTIVKALGAARTIAGATIVPAAPSAVRLEEKRDATDGEETLIITPPFACRLRKA